MIDLPPASPPVATYTAAINRETCVLQAAAHYRAHPDLVRAIIRTEKGTTGKVSYNKNGSFDMGLMQINSVHLADFKKFNISRDMLVNNECLNIFIGTYLLRRGMLGTEDFWKGVGNYHSTTPEKNALYKQRVWENLKVIQGRK